MTTESGEFQAKADRGKPCAWLRTRWPRPEALLLALALVWTLASKLIIVIGQKPGNLVVDLLAAWLPDVTFFGSIVLLFALIFATGWHRLAARICLVVSAIILTWSVFNAAWLISAGAQLQPGVAWVLLHDAAAFWPIVEGRLASQWHYAIAILATGIVAAGWFFWRTVRPRSCPRGMRRHLRRAAISAAFIAASVMGTRLTHGPGLTAYSSQAVGFSSHWYALVHGVSRVAPGSDVAAPLRVLPRAGTVAVTVPQTAGDQRPNVVLIFLESVSYQVSSLSDPSKDTTPNLLDLASQGIEFTSTRVPIPMTDKAFWTALTGRTPDVQDDYVEAVIAEEPYESLASLLARQGYRSAFFEVSKGSFKCAPGLFANLAFDWAWFRENLEDPSAHIGPLNGDDFRLIEPMFDWVEQSDEPFLLSMITTVAHFPYELPDWYEHEHTEDRFAKYLQAVKFSDAFLGEVDAQLKERGLAERTILCVIGDHGEGFRPESRYGRWAPFEEIIRIPWVIRWPGHVEPGRKIDWPCSQLDVTPTLLKLLGFQIDRAGFDGKDALVASPPDRRHYFMTWFRKSPIGFLEGSRKVVYWPYTDALFEYDLASDPGEKLPRQIRGTQRDQWVNQIRQWQRTSQIEVPVHRFRKRRVFDRWQTFSSGRLAWAYYAPMTEDSP